MSPLFFCLFFVAEPCMIYLILFSTAPTSNAPTLLCSTRSFTLETAQSCTIPSKRLLRSCVWLILTYYTTCSYHLHHVVLTVAVEHLDQLPWMKWSNFISFMTTISFLCWGAISFIHGIYFIYIDLYFILSWNLFHSLTALISFLCLSTTSFIHGSSFISFTALISFLHSNAISFFHGIYFICIDFHFIPLWPLFHSVTEFISFFHGT